MSSPGGNFTSGAVLHKIVLKVSAFQNCFGPKNSQRDDLVKNPKFNPNNHCRCRTVVFVTQRSV